MPTFQIAKSRIIAAGENAVFGFVPSPNWQAFIQITSHDNEKYTEVGILRIMIETDSGKPVVTMSERFGDYSTDPEYALIPFAELSDKGWIEDKVLIFLSKI